MHLPGRHALSWRVEDEHREGRGHDIEATAMDGEYAAWLTIDVYGNGDEGWATLLTEHNSANDECPCEDCTAYREEG